METTFDKFAALQHALRELNYSQRLTEDSVPLVEAIFSDLVDITRKYQKMKENVASMEHQVRTKLEPLQLENSKLLESNTRLHRELIQLSNHSDGQVTDLKQENAELSTKCKELEFLLKSKEKVIYNQKINIDNLKARLDKQRKPRKSHLVVQGVHGLGGKHQAPQPSIKLVNPLSPVASDEEKECDKIEKHFDDDLDGMDALNALNSLNADEAKEELARLEQENRALQTQMVSLQETQTRDKCEIARLEHMLQRERRESRRLSDVQEKGSIAASAAKAGGGDLGLNLDKLNKLEKLFEQEQESVKMKHLQSEVEIMESELIEKENHFKDKIAEMKGKYDGLVAQHEALQERFEKAMNELKSCRKYKNKYFKQEGKDIGAGDGTDTLASTAKANVEQLKKNLNNEARIRELMKKNEILEGKIAKLEKTKQTMFLKNKEIKNDNLTVTASVTLKNKELASMKSQLTEYISKCKDLECKLNETNYETQNVRNECKFKDTEMKSHLNLIETLKNEKSCIMRSNENLEKTLKNTEALVAKLKKQNQELHFQIRAKSSEIEDFQNRLHSLSQDRSKLKTEENTKTSENFALKSQVSKLEFLVKDYENQLELNKQLLSSQASKVANLEQQTRDLQFNYEKCHESLHLCKASLSDANSKLKLRSNEVAELKIKLNQSNELITRLQIIKNEMSSENDENAQLLIANSAMDNENQRLRLDLKSLELELNNRSERVRDLEEERRKQMAVLENLRHSNKSLSQQNKLLMSEKQGWSLKYQECKTSLDCLRNERSTLEAQKNDVVLKLNLLTSQNATLSHEIENNNKLETKATDNINLLKKSVLDLETLNSELNNKVNSLLKQEANLKLVLSNKENEMSRLREKLQQAEGEMKGVQVENNRLFSIKCTEVSKNSELKTLCNQLDYTNKQLQNKLNNLVQENNGLVEKIEKVEAQKRDMLQKEGKLEETVQTLRHALNKLNDSNDELQCKIDSKIEIISSLQTSIEQHKNEQSNMNGMICDLQQQFEHCKSLLITKSNECDQLAKKLRALDLKLNETKEESLLKSQQIRMLSETNENLTKENDFVNKEFSNAITERDTKCTELERVLNKLLVIEESNKMIDSEKQQILLNYRKLNNENERLMLANNELEQVKSKLDLQLSTMTEQIKKRDLRIETLNKNVSECHLNIHTLQRSNQQLSRALERATHSAEQSRTISQSLMRDLEATRSVQVSSESKLGQTSEQIALLKENNSQFLDTIRELEMEKQQARDALNLTEGKVENLEKIIEQLRVEHVENGSQSEQLRHELTQLSETNHRLEKQLKKQNHSVGSGRLKRGGKMYGRND